MDGRGGAGDAPHAGVVPQRPVGGVPGVPDRAGTNQPVSGSCSIAGCELRPLKMPPGDTTVGSPPTFPPPVPSAGACPNRGIGAPTAPGPFTTYLGTRG